MQIIKENVTVDLECEYCKSIVRVSKEDLEETTIAITNSNGMVIETRIHYIIKCPCCTEHLYSSGCCKNLLPNIWFNKENKND